MTLFIPDWSNNNWASTAQALAACAQVIHSEGYSGIIHKVSEGSYYADPYWPAVRDWCSQNTVPCIGYHYVTGDDPGAQVQKWLANGGGKAVMLDIEANSGDIGNITAVANAFEAAGIAVAIEYFPHWYWQQIGSPDISHLPGVLTSSSYYERNNYASTEYSDAGGDTGPGWAAYGGVTPTFWQFSDGAQMAGFTADANAFRGTLDQLTAIFNGTATGFVPPVTPAPTTTPEVTMADIDSLAEQIRAKLDGVAAVDGPGIKKGQPYPYNQVSQDRPRVPGDRPIGQVTTPSALDHMTHAAVSLTGVLWLDETTGLDLWSMLAVYVLNLVQAKGLPYVKQLIASCPQPPAGQVSAMQAAQAQGAAISWDLD